jgi:hypothetical protein
MCLSSITRSFRFRSLIPEVECGVTRTLCVVFVRDRRCSECPPAARASLPVSGELRTAGKVPVIKKRVRPKALEVSLGLPVAATERSIGQHGGGSCRFGSKDRRTLKFEDPFWILEGRAKENL